MSPINQRMVKFNLDLWFIRNCHNSTGRPREERGGSSNDETVARSNAVSGLFNDDLALEDFHRLREICPLPEPALVLLFMRICFPFRWPLFMLDILKNAFSYSANLSQMFESRLQWLRLNPGEFGWERGFSRLGGGRGRGSLAIKRRDHLSAVLFCNELPVHGEFHSREEKRVRESSRHWNRGMLLAIVRKTYWVTEENVKILSCGQVPADWTLLRLMPSSGIALNCNI